jgi:Zn-dependent protease with chaperone function
LCCLAVTLLLVFESHSDDDLQVAIHLMLNFSFLVLGILLFTLIVLYLARAAEKI